MGYSRDKYPYSGGAQDFVFSPALGVLNPGDVQAYVVGEVDGLGNQLYRPYTWITPNTLRITNPLPNPCNVIVQRTVTKTALETDFSGTGAVTKTSLARGFKQLMMNIHELLDGRLDSFTGALLDSVLGIKNEAQAARVGAETAQSAAAASATAANSSKVAAATSETNAATSASTATTQAGIATTKAGEAGTSATTASAQAGIATTKAGEAAGSATTATTKASEASTSANTATAQAGIATTKAGEASASASAAAGSAAAAASSADQVDLTRQVPSGAVQYFATGAAPTGWLKANGALVSRSTYAALFSAIGTTFGAGDGSTTFQLPDLRGEFLRALDDGRGIDTGRALGSAQGDANKAHSHGGSTGSAGDHAHTLEQYRFTGGNGGAGGPGGLVAPGGQLSSGGAWTAVPSTNAINSARMTTTGAHTHTISSDGGAEARPRNVAMLACIKY